MLLSTDTWDSLQEPTYTLYILHLPRCDWKSPHKISIELKPTFINFLGPRGSSKSVWNLGIMQPIKPPFCSNKPLRWSLEQSSKSQCHWLSGRATERERAFLHLNVFIIPRKHINFRSFLKASDKRQISSFQWNSSAAWASPGSTLAMRHFPLPQCSTRAHRRLVLQDIPKQAKIRHGKMFLPLFLPKNAWDDWMIWDASCQLGERWFNRLGVRDPGSRGEGQWHLHARASSRCWTCLKVWMWTCFNVSFLFHKSIIDMIIVFSNYIWLLDIISLEVCIPFSAQMVNQTGSPASGWTYSIAMRLVGTKERLSCDHKSGTS